MSGVQTRIWHKEQNLKHNRNNKRYREHLTITGLKLLIKCLFNYQTGQQREGETDSEKEKGEGETNRETDGQKKKRKIQTGTEREQERTREAGE